jgi:hypothetical protein
VDHDLLSRTHVEFPLPGEGSQVDTAISLFKLARIIGRTLEDLYTTTRRRGGIAKITHLQAEVDMWERDSFPADMASSLSVTSLSLEALYLRITHCVSTIHIHRPALSFTKPDPQFITSLRACGQASSRLIRLLSYGLANGGVSLSMNEDPMSSDEQSNDMWRKTLFVAFLYPNGVHMLWQAGLTVLFARWKGYPITADQDETLIKSCIETLRQLHIQADDAGNHVSQCADVLDLLREKIFSRVQTPLNLEQLQWNVWDWPIESALEFANTLDTAPLDLSLDSAQWL